MENLKIDPNTLQNFRDALPNPQELYDISSFELFYKNLFNGKTEDVWSWLIKSKHAKEIDGKFFFDGKKLGEYLDTLLSETTVPAKSFPDKYKPKKNEKAKEEEVETSEQGQTAQIGKKSLRVLSQHQGELENPTKMTNTKQTTQLNGYSEPLGVGGFPIPILNSIIIEPEPGTEVKKNKTINDFLRVGDDYFEIVHIPNKYGDLVKSFAKRLKSTIIDDFGRYAPKHIKKYTGFCCVPSHTNYKYEINGFYNRYTELTHTPTQGECVTILNFVKHIFGEQYEMGLDYLQLLYEKPTQKLPILCLVSNENNTGKSTFGDLLKMIFGHNTTKVSNSDLASNFNAPYAQKLIIILDETSIEKNAITQAVKRMSTEQGTIIINEKNVNQYEVDFFGKFVFISNNETRFMHIEEKDTRFWVVKVPTITEIDPNTPQKIALEIQAFLYYLSQRKLHHKHKSRMYFDLELLETDAKQKAKEANIHPAKKEIIELVKDTFEAYPYLIELEMGISDILTEIKENGNRYANRQKTKEMLSELEEDGKCKKMHKKRYKHYSLKLAEASANTQEPINGNSVPYFFKIEDYLGVEELNKRLNLPINEPKGGELSTLSTRYQHEKNTYPNG